MPPKRKQQTTNKNGATNPTVSTKKIKKSDENNQLDANKKGGHDNKLCWHWQVDETEWKRFAQASENAINTAFIEKKSQVAITDDEEDAVVNFAKMTCTNINSGNKSNLRCGLISGKDIFVWQWQDIQGEQHIYNPAQMMLLENSFQTGEPRADLKLGTRKYTIDFKAWTQTANSTKEMKSLSRVKFDVGKKTEAAKSKVDKKKSVDEKEKVETISFSGKRPVDSVCEAKLHSAHVFFEENTIWDVTLNQTNLQFNNNKFYKIQLLEDNSKKSYSIWFRWGRVGQTGQSKLTECGSDVSKAKSLFESKFFDKTKNNWYYIDEFKKVPGKYDILNVDYSASEEDAKRLEPVKKHIPESKLDKSVKDLIELICDLKAMEDVVLEMKFDAKKAPLGKLTTGQIKAGYSSLKVIEELINKHQLGKELVEACNAFYTRIPHNFGMKTPPLIKTLPEIQNKIMLLEALGDIQIAIKLMNENPDTLLHPVDNHYRSLKCELIPLKKESSDYKIVEQYLSNTHGITHNLYVLSIEDIFKCEKEEEKDRFLDVGNRMLLWHGSRLTNWAGILGKGLRIAPPEAPVSGYMFGKGIYFADMCSKSANYCFPTNTFNTGLLLLCEVSLGEWNELIDANFNANNLPTGKHSVKAKGRYFPNPEETLELADGVKVSYGKGWDSNSTNSERYSLHYNEYIVYNVNQVRMRYLVKVKFNYNK